MDTLFLKYFKIWESTFDGELKSRVNTQITKIQAPKEYVPFIYLKYLLSSSTFSLVSLLFPAKTSSSD